MSFAKRFLAVTIILLMVVGVVTASVGMAGDRGASCQRENRYWLVGTRHERVP